MPPMHYKSKAAMTMFSPSVSLVACDVPDSAHTSHGTYCHTHTVQSSCQGAGLATERFQVISLKKRMPVNKSYQGR